jgi:isopentenyl-diphosphate delta-isomerase type 1
MSKIILVNEKDEVIGECDKLEAHQKGLLHRAFSIFIYRVYQDSIELLLQKRHPEKYHSGGLWTNTCCSHPYPHENIKEAAIRRLREEVGITANLKEIGIFYYCKPVGNNLIENEMDHVFMGEIHPPAEIQFNPEEISEIKWIEINQLKKDIQENSKLYTVWLEEALSFISNLRGL